MQEKDDFIFGMKPEDITEPQRESMRQCGAALDRIMAKKVLNGEILFEPLDKEKFLLNPYDYVLNALKT